MSTDAGCRGGAVCNRFLVTAGISPLFPGSWGDLKDPQGEGTVRLQMQGYIQKAQENADLPNQSFQ